jgi:hypothetical protein
MPVSSSWTIRDPHQSGDVGRSDRRRADLHHVGSDHVERGGEGAGRPQQIGRGHPAGLGGAGAGGTRRVQHVNVDGHEDRSGADQRDRLGHHVADPALGHVVHEQRGDAALALPGEHLLTGPVAAQADLDVARHVHVP